MIICQYYNRCPIACPYSAALITAKNMLWVELFKHAKPVFNDKEECAFWSVTSSLLSRIMYVNLISMSSPNERLYILTKVSCTFFSNLLPLVIDGQSDLRSKHSLHIFTIKITSKNGTTKAS